jgi:hypothetical protein
MYDYRQWQTHLDVVALVVVTTLPEKSVSYDPTSIEHVKYGVSVLPVSVVSDASACYSPWIGKR